MDEVIEGVLPDKYFLEEEKREAVIKKILKIYKNPVSMSKILKMVSDYYQIDAQVLTSGSRNHKLSQARKIIMFLCCKLAYHSFGKITLFCGIQKNDLAAFASCKIEKEMRNNAEFQQEICYLKIKLVSL